MSAVKSSSKRSSSPLSNRWPCSAIVLVIAIFGEIADWLLEESGIELMLADQSFQRRRNRRGRPTTRGRIAYQGPNPQPTSPKVRLDITTDEVLVERP